MPPDVKVRGGRCFSSSSPREMPPPAQLNSLGADIDHKQSERRRRQESEWSEHNNGTTFRASRARESRLLAVKTIGGGGLVAGRPARYFDAAAFSAGGVGARNRPVGPSEPLEPLDLSGRWLFKCGCFAGQPQLINGAPPETVARRVSDVAEIRHLPRRCGGLKIYLHFCRVAR